MRLLPTPLSSPAPPTTVTRLPGWATAWTVTVNQPRPESRPTGRRPRDPLLRPPHQPRDRRQPFHQPRRPAPVSSASADRQPPARPQHPPDGPSVAASRRVGRGRPPPRRRTPRRQRQRLSPTARQPPPSPAPNRRRASRPICGDGSPTAHRPPAASAITVTPARAPLPAPAAFRQENQRRLAPGLPATSDTTKLTASWTQAA